jgi:hypothetical protein
MEAAEASRDGWTAAAGIEIRARGPHVSRANRIGVGPGRRKEARVLRRARAEAISSVKSE